MTNPNTRLADKLRENIEREKTARAERERKAQEEARQRLIANFSENLNVLKSTFIGLVEEGKIELNVIVWEGHPLHDGFNQFRVQETNGTPYLGRLDESPSPELQAAWDGLKGWATLEGLDLRVLVDASGWSDDHSDYEYVVELSLPEAPTATGSDGSK